MSRRRLVVAALALVGAVVAAIGIWQALGRQPTAVLSGGSRPAPSFQLADLRHGDGSITLRQFAGRPLVVNFWASWCTPCRTETPVLEAAARHARGEVTFLGINVNDARSDAAAFVAKFNVTYPIAYDPSGSTTGPYGLFGLPTTVFVNRSGTIVGTHAGAFDARTLAAALAQAFAVS